MADTTALLTNQAYGYPNRGDLRRIAPRRLMCIHITANPSDPPATAKQERDYANRTGSGGPSAHSYLERTGSFVHAIQTSYAAWSNGVLRSPKLTTPGISDVVALKASGFNPNEDYYREVETCGRYAPYPVTDEQMESLSRIIAEDSITTGLPISRATVHLHSDLDTEQRPNCPVPASLAEPFAASIINRAIVIYGTLRESNMTWDELLAELDKRYKDLLSANEVLVASNLVLTTELEDAKVKAAQIEQLAIEIKA